METIKITSMPKNHRAEQVHGLMNEYYSSMHQCIFSINEYYSFIHAWFIHRFLRENILVIHSSCARIIHLFTLGGNAYSLPSREGEYQSISLQSTTSKLQIK